MKDRLIQWYCASPAHRGKPDDVADRLTIHDGEWAFCPLDSRADEHDWRRTGGLELERGAGRGPIVLRSVRAG
jgi:hypothetical protein